MVFVGRACRLEGYLEHSADVDDSAVPEAYGQAPASRAGGMAKRKELKPVASTDGRPVRLNAIRSAKYLIDVLKQ